MNRCIFCKGYDLCVTCCGDEQYNVLCNDCGAEGPIAADEKLAERLWDRTKDYVDYHEVIKIIEGFQPIKMGGYLNNHQKESNSRSRFLKPASRV